MSPEQIAEQIRPLWCDGEVRELRVPGTSGSGTVSGYFSSPEALAAAAAAWSGRAPGVYMTLNPVEPALIARASNHTRPRAKTTTQDRDIVRRRWLPIDFDPVRPADISSSEDEHDGALERAKTCGRWLKEMGIAGESLVFADSGNGAHLLIHVDLPNDEASTKIVKAVLDALSAKFSCHLVAIDTACYNAARIWKVYGTLACKGDNVPSRPHRTAQTLWTPLALIPTPEAILETIAAYAPVAEITTNTHRVSGGFDIDAFIARHLADRVKSASAWNGGRRWILSECLFNPDHVGTSAALFELATGALAYKCQHNSCVSRSWSDVRQLFEGTQRSWGGGSGGVGTAAASSSTVPRLAYFNSMADVEYRPISYLWYPNIPIGKITMLDGDPGLGKSWFTLAVAAAVTRGLPLPRDDRSGREPGRILLVASEDDLEDTTKSRLEATGADQSLIRPVTGVFLSEADEETGLTLGPEGLYALETHIAEYRPMLVIIDPLLEYLDDVDGNKAGEVRRALRPLREIAKRRNVAILCVRHLNKSVGVAAIYRGQGSMDFVAVVRSGLLVGEDPEDRERLIMAPYKNNLARKGNAVAFRLPCERTGGRFAWEIEDDMDANSLLNVGSGDEGRSAMREAKTFIIGILRAGAAPAKDIIREARETGIAEITLRRARVALGVQISREGGIGYRGAGRSLWALPELPAKDNVINNVITIGNLENDQINSGPKNGVIPPEIGDHNILLDPPRVPRNDDQIDQVDDDEEEPPF